MSWECRALSLQTRLTGHLVREIIFRGSGGWPLTPLASQPNHELTRLQGQRIEGTLALAFIWKAVPSRTTESMKDVHSKRGYISPLLPAPRLPRPESFMAAAS